MRDLVRGWRIDSTSTNVDVVDCCLSFAQEGKNELGLLLGAELIRSAATTSNQKLSFGRSVA